MRAVHPGSTNDKTPADLQWWKCAFPPRLLSSPSFSTSSHFTFFFFIKICLTLCCQVEKKKKKKKEGVNTTPAPTVQQCERRGETKVAGGGKDRKSPSHLPWAVGGVSHPCAVPQC